MKKTYIIFIMITTGMTAFAQEFFISSRFTNAISVEKDSFLMYSTLGDQFAALTEQNNFVVMTDPIFFSFSDSLSTATDDLIAIDGLSTFPNPVTTTLHISRNLPDEGLIVRLYQRDGILLTQKEWPTGESVIELAVNKYPPGLFLLTVINIDETRGGMFKVVKE